MIQERFELLKKNFPNKHFTTLDDNDCDLIALTQYEGGEPVDYVTSDEDLQAWLEADPNHSWFPVELDEEYADLPEEDTIHRPGSINTDKDFEDFIRDYLEREYETKVESFTYEFDMRRIYIHNIIWK